MRPPPIRWTSTAKCAIYNENTASALAANSLDQNTGRRQIKISAFSSFTQTPIRPGEATYLDLCATPSSYLPDLDDALYTWHSSTAIHDTATDRLRRLDVA